MKGECVEIRLLSLICRLFTIPLKRSESEEMMIIMIRGKESRIKRKNKYKYLSKRLLDLFFPPGKNRQDSIPQKKDM